MQNASVLVCNNYSGRLYFTISISAIRNHMTSIIKWVSAVNLHSSACQKQSLLCCCKYTSSFHLQPKNGEADTPYVSPYKSFLVARVYFNSRWTSRRTDWKRLLGTVLPRTWHTARWANALGQNHRRRRRFV